MVDPELAAVGYPDEYRPLPTASPSGPSSPAPADDSTAAVARQEADEIAGTAKDAGAQVVESAKEQVGVVTQEAGRQARDLVDQLRSEASDQAATQQQRAAGGLRSLADELSGMASRSEQEGPATDLARQAADRLHDVAQWLENRDPGDVLDEVRSFARRRPGAYLALAAGAGVLAGRLTRGLTAPDDAAAHSPRLTPGSAALDRRPESATANGEAGTRSPGSALPPGPAPAPRVGGNTPGGAGTYRAPGVPAESVGPSDRPMSTSLTESAPATGGAGDSRR